VCSARSQPAPAKRPLKHSDADSWRSIAAPQIAPNGKFVAYAIMPQEGDGEYVVRNLRTFQEWRLHTGGSAASAAATVPSSRPSGVRGGFLAGTRLAFTPDSRLLLISVSPTKAEIETARKDKKDLPRPGLVILDLATGQQTRLDGVRTWTLPEESSTYLAYFKEAKPEPSKDPMQPTPNPRPRPAPTQTQRKVYGSELVLRNLFDKSERSFADVVEHRFTKDGKTLVYTVSSKSEENNGVYLIQPGNPAPAAALIAGKGRYQGLTWDEPQTQIVFLAEPEEKSATPATTNTPRFKLYHWERKSGSVSFALPPAAPWASLVCLSALQMPLLTPGKATDVVSTTTPGFKNGWILSDRGGLTFSRDGSRVFLSVVPAPPAAAPAVPASQRVDLDLWHWKDDYIQPMQKVRAELERNRTYRAVYHLKDKKYLQIADETLADINVAAEGSVILGADDRAYRRLMGSGTFTGFADYFIVNPTTGARTPLLKKLEGGLNISPGGKYALFFDGKHWNSLVLATSKTFNLTEKVGAAFFNEEHDTPGPARPYGIAGWTADDASVILHDRYDLWQIAPDGTSAKNLTQGMGRRNNLRFGYLRLDPKERVIDLGKPLLLSATNLQTRDEGFYRLDLRNGPPRCLLMAARSFSIPVKAKHADVYLMMAQSFNEFPDLIVSDPDFKEMKKISDANPQKKQFIWGNAQLVHFKSADGKPLQGMLIKPESFEPGKKYPMVVYIYERLSQGLHRFVSPRPGTSINPTYYASNGYLVFMPDIAYTVGSPGQSALKCVLPGIQAVADMGIVDEKAIGIQGHSWGGYQIAYMITQTTRFKAAIAGAPVSDMVSAYGGVRWGTGLPRQFQYEQTQSRIGGTLWQYPTRFIENSPIFKADQVQTPLLMLHNDMDDAVPWFQGIEYFLALRRLEKEVYLCNYNGELHGLRKRANQKDYTVRMQEFFDHHLRGAPKPSWMEKGVSYLERVRTNGPSSTPLPAPTPGTMEEEP
jgi:dienelactone hydrolase